MLMVDRLRSYRVMRLRPVVGVLDAQALRLLLDGRLLETGLVLHLDHLLLSLDPRVRQDVLQVNALGISDSVVSLQGYKT